MRRILVTGAARGLGAETALALAALRFAVVIHYRNRSQEAESVAAACKAKGGEAEILKGDLGTPEGVHRFIEHYQERFGETYGLVNNVGNYLMATALNTSEEEWFSLFQTNLHAPFSLIKALLPMIKKEKGRIVNIGNTGLLSSRAHGGATAYRMTKAALWTLTRSLAKELAPHPVTVNMVSPGYMENAIDLPDPKTLPMRRAATLQEVAHIITHLFSEDYAYITGQNIEVAGAVGL